MKKGDYMNKTKCPKCGYEFIQGAENKCPRCGAIINNCKGCSGNCLKCNVAKG
jgi:rubrerythrin